LPITVFVRVSLTGHTETLVQQFENHMHSVDQVLECFVMTGTSDYLLRVVVADLVDYERFVRKHLQPIGSVGSIDSSFVYGVMKKTNVFPAIA